MDTRFQSPENRRRNRLPDYDYSQPGAYYLTICTDARKHIFGEVSGSEVKLTVCGKIVLEVCNGLPRHYPCVELDAFIVMPDHVHAVIIIVDFPSQINTGDGLNPSPTIKRHTLPEIVRGFKSLSTKKINQFRGSPGASVWQRSFYEHVVRSTDDLNDIRKYIAQNPIRWELNKNAQTME